MRETKKNEKEQTIKTLQDRLNWLVYEANKAEYNEAELEAISKLLQVMEPIETKDVFLASDSANERFWKYYQPRESEESKVILSFEDKVGAKRAEAKINISRTARPFMKYAPVAALVAALFLGGTIGVYAEKNGFFHTAKTDEGNMIIATSPNPIDTDVNGQKEYTAMEDVPVKYLQLLWTPARLAKDFELEKINIISKTNYVIAECQFLNGEKFVKCVNKKYEEVIRLYDINFDSFELISSETINDVKVEYYKKVSNDDVEYMTYFFVGKNIYIMNTNIELEDVKNMIEDSLKDM